MVSKLRVGVVGAGHFGRYHAQKYSAAEDCELVGIVDSNPAQAEKLAAETGGEPMGDVEQLLAAGVEAVSVTVPTGAHFEVASRCLAADKHVLVEKPIAASLEEGQKLVDLAEERGVMFQVGHLERFSTAFEQISARITTPLYLECHRVAMFQPRGTDVGVVLDLMIHDIDLVLALVNSPVLSVDAVGAAVVSASEDIVNARIRFENGAAANVTASRVSLKTKREIRLFQPDCYIRADLVSGELASRRKGEGEIMPGIPKIEQEDIQIPKGDSLQREIAAFVRSVRTGEPPLVSGRDGLEALRVATAIRDSLVENQQRLRSHMPDMFTD